MMDNTGITDFVGGISEAHIEPSDIDLDADPSGGEEDYITNTHGEKFDPTLHVTNADGSPRLTKHGKFRLRPGRRASLNRPDEPPQKDESLTLAAETAASIYINSGIVIFGPEWLPDAAKMEREQLVSAFEAYFEAKGITDIPPGVALTIALFGYAAPRLYMPETQSRISRAIEWTKIKFAWMRFRRNSNAPRLDPRPDRMRQDNSSQNDSERGWFWRRSGSRA